MAPVSKIVILLAVVFLFATIAQVAALPQGGVPGPSKVNDVLGSVLSGVDGVVGDLLKQNAGGKPGGAAKP